MTVRRLYSIIVMLLAATLWAGIAPGSAQTNANGREPYKIGVTFPLTGPLAQITSEYIPALQIAADQINKAGGAKGHPIRLIMEDSQGTPQGGLAAMRKLVQVDGVQAIITIYTNVTTAQIPLADELKVPIMATVEGPGIMSKGQYSFGNAVTITDMAPLIGDYWQAKHVKRVFALFGNNGYGQSIASYVKNAAVTAGAEYTEAFLDMASSDYRGVLARVKDFNPDAIFITAQGSAIETSAIRQIRELGITTQIYAPANFFESKNYREGLGPYIEGMIFGGLYIDPARKTPFLVAYRAQQHQVPVYPAAENYDIVKIYADAFARSSSYSGEAIHSALMTTKGVPSVFGGSLAMRDTHYSTISALGLYQVKQGKLVSIWGGAAKPRGGTP